MTFKEWVLQHEGKPCGFTNFVFQVMEDKYFPEKSIKTVATMMSYLKRRKYSVEMRRQARICFKAWQAYEKAPRDEFSARDKERVKKALRQVWSWSYSRRLCIERCTDEKGFVYCEAAKCPSGGKAVPRIHVDHIKPVGSVDRGVLERLFVPSTQLQGLCGPCHRIKTNADNARTRANPHGVKGGKSRKTRRDFTDEF